jgi:hypothetical protein
MAHHARPARLSPHTQGAHVGEPAHALALLWKSPWLLDKTTLPASMVSTKALSNSLLHIIEVPDASLPASMVSTDTSRPRRPPRAHTGLAKGPTPIYGSSAYTRRRHGSSGARGNDGHGERPLATVAWLFRAPKTTV